LIINSILGRMHLLDKQFFIIDLSENLMNFTLRQLLAFVTVYKAGSFTKAAQELHLTQSALSGLVRELETNLELKLFDRTTRQLSLSVTGAQLLPAAMRVLNEVQDLGDEIKSLKNLEHGEVKIAVTQQLASAKLPKILAQFKTRYPQIRLEVIDCGVEAVQECVRDTTVDIGIGPERALGHGLKQEPLFDLPFHLVTPPEHPFTQRDYLSWADLEDAPLITLDGSFAELLADDLLQQSAQKLGPIEYKVRFMSTALSMVKHGLGLTLCLPYVREWVAQNNLVMIPIQEPEIRRKFFLYSRKNRNLSPAVQAFVELFAAEIKKT